MNHIQSYKLFESESKDDITNIIKECFFGVSDMIEETMNYGVRVNKFDAKNNKKLKQLGIGTRTYPDYEVMIIPTILPQEDGERYRPTNMNMEMVDEIENSISLIRGTTRLKFDFTVIEYLNVYDYNKGELGPGSDIKKFDNLSQLQDFYDFLRLKGDKVRWIKILFY